MASKTVQQLLDDKEAQRIFSKPRTRFNILTGTEQPVRSYDDLARDWIKPAFDIDATETALRGLIDHARSQSMLTESTRRELTATRAELARVKAAQAAVPATPTTSPDATLDASAFKFDLLRNNSDGRLRRVSLRAPGFRDTHFDIYRDTTGRMREIKMADE